MSIAPEHAERRATDHVAQPWAIRSTLLAVAELDRSVAFYRELGPFDEIVREDAVTPVGELLEAVAHWSNLLAI